MTNEKSVELPADFTAILTDALSPQVKEEEPVSRRFSIDPELMEKVRRRDKLEADASQEEVRINSKTIFDALKAKGIDYVTVSFNGGHDEGYINDPEFHKEKVFDKHSEKIPRSLCVDDEGTEVCVEDIATEACKCDVTYVALRVEDLEGALLRRETNEDILVAISYIAEKAILNLIGNWWDGDIVTDGSLIIDIRKKRLLCDFEELERVGKTAFLDLGEEDEQEDAAHDK